MGECRGCAYNDRPIYKWPCDVCRDTKNGRSMYCPEEADHITKTDYISREAARPDAFCEGVSCQECPFLKNSVTGGCRVDDFIKAIPAADVRPAPKGHWVSFDAESEKCSNCKRRYYISALFAVGGNNEPDFCPGCGAYMGGDACAE